MVTSSEVDALLPQTQCGLCGYKRCLPYAEAIVNHDAALNLCPPGGTTTLLALGRLMQQNVNHQLDAMQVSTKPRTTALIHEDQCIGCTKCIQACPVDAISGAAKLMHTVIQAECTGCELCIPACPVDCINVVPQPAMPVATQQAVANLARSRYRARNQRLAIKDPQLTPLAQAKTDSAVQVQKQHYIQAALARVQQKRKA